MAEIRKSIIIPDRKLRDEQFSKYEVIQASIFLDIFNMGQTINVLPMPGGLLDQDSFYVYLMRHALLCQQDKRELDEAKRRAEHG